MTVINGHILSKLDKNRKDRNLVRRLLRDLALSLEYQSDKLETKIFTEPGVVATVPGISPDTDIAFLQSAFNIPDLVRFENLGDYIVQHPLTITQNFTVTDIVPTSINEQTSSNAIVVTGTGFEFGMTAEITSDNGTFVIDSISVGSSTEMTIITTVTGDIIADEVATLVLTKKTYSVQGTFTLSAALEILSDNISGVADKSASTVFNIQLTKNISSVTLVETDNVNVTVNSNDGSYTTGGPGLEIDLDCSAAAYEEAFNLIVTGDGETTPNYAMVIATELVITSSIPELAYYNDSGGVDSYITLNTSKSTSGYNDSLESNNPNVTIVHPGYSSSNSLIAVQLDTTNASSGEAFSLRITVNGEVTEWFEMFVGYAYEEFSEVGTDLASFLNSYGNITGWDKETNKTLFFEATDEAIDKVYAYESSADRTTGPSAAVFHLVGNDINIVEENASGYGGTLDYIATAILTTLASEGQKMYVHTSEFSYAETDEVGTPSNDITNYGTITGWDKIATPLYLYIFDDGPNNIAEFYDNATSRDNRTTGDILATTDWVIGENPVNEQNSSGFQGDITIVSETSSDGDKMYVTAS